MKKKIIAKILAGTLAVATAFTMLPATSFVANATEVESDDEQNVYHYVTMNVPYTDFYKAYNLKDMAVWKVADGVDAVSTATTSKFLGTTGLAKGTYNNGTYIMGVTLPVAVSETDYSNLDKGLTDQDAYYFTEIEGTPEVYSELTVEDNGSYSFSQLQDAKTDIIASIEGPILDGGYGDYQINLIGITPDGNTKTTDGNDVNLTVYGAILKTGDNNAYGMTTLENLWFGTRVDNMEIAWSVIGGQGLCRGHGKGDPYYQFDMNGATLNCVSLITDKGIVDISCDIELPEYYTGNLTGLTYSISNNSNVLNISGIPEDLEDVMISVSGGLAANAMVENDQVTLKSIPTDGTNYTLTISSSNYPDITRTMSTPISETQIEKLKALISKAKATTGYDGNADLNEHVAEAEEMIGKEDETSYNAATLISELEEKIKETYPAAEATATLKGKELNIELIGVSLDNLVNPTYTLSYSKGHGSATLTSGNLTSLTLAIDAEPEVDKEYTLTIISDNYQNITTTVTAAEAEKDNGSTGDDGNTGNTGNTDTGSAGSTGSGSAGNTGAGSAGNTDTGSTGDTGSTTTTISVKKGKTYTVGNYKYKVTKVATSKAAGTVTVTGGKNKKLTSVSIPKTVKLADKKSYKVTKVAANAFKNYTKAKKITIGANVKSIGANAFYGCTKATKITIGKNVSSIGKKAFYNCKKAKTVTVSSKKLTSKKVGASAFKKLGASNYKKVTVKVPSSKLKAYKKFLTKKGLSSKAKIKK